jgi:hypothetical protein
MIANKVAVCSSQGFGSFQWYWKGLGISGNMDNCGAVLCGKAYLQLSSGE